MVAGEQGVASLNQVGAPRGHNFGVGEQLDMGAEARRPTSGDGVLGDRGSQPLPIS